MRCSHDTANPRLVDVLTSEARSAIHWLEELGVEFTREVSNGSNGQGHSTPAAIGSRAAEARRGTDCCRSATARGTRSRRRSARRTRQAAVRSSRTTRCAPSHRAAPAGSRPSRRRRARPTSKPPAVVLAAGGRCFAEAETRGELSTNHPNATGEATRIALEAGAEARDLDALQYHPNGGAWPSTMQGYSIPETTRAYGAVLLNADGEEFTDSLGPRDAVSQAIFDEVENGQGRADRRTVAPPSGSTRRASRTRTPRSRFRTCSAATAERESIRSRSRSTPTPSSTTRTVGS